MACRLFACLLLLTCALSAAAQHSRHAAAAVPLRFQPRSHALTIQLGGGLGDGGLTASYGLTYEQFVDGKGKLSLFLPLQGFVGGSLAIGEIDEGQLRTSAKGFFAAPGLRYHPSSNTRRADFSLGLALMLGKEHLQETYRPRAYSREPWRQQDKSDLLAGFLMQAQAQFQSWREGVFGLFLNIGICPWHVPSVMGGGAGGYLQLGLSFGKHW